MPKYLHVNNVLYDLQKIVHSASDRVLNDVKTEVFLDDKYRLLTYDFHHKSDNTTNGRAP